MSLLFETIKVQNRILQNIDYHNERLNRARKDLFGRTDYIDLREEILIPKQLSNETIKCRVLYGKDIDQVQFVPYTKREIKTLKIVECDTIEYYYKFVDRKIFSDLLNSVQTDDILIVKNGMVTDTSFANIIFYDGVKWVTPSTPLLRGTKREKLLKEKTIFEETISRSDIIKFKKAALINAMLDIEDSPIIEIENII